MLPFFRFAFAAGLLCASVLIAGAEPLTVQLPPGDQQAAPSPLKLGSNTAPGGRSFSLNSVCFLRDGKPFLPVVGEMQFARVPRADWDDEILKMKNAGVDVIATYVFWLFHEEIEGQYDWTGNRSLSDFLQTCRKRHMQVLLRIGPWVHAELRNGGFPDWLLKDHGKVRTSDPLFLKAVDRYFGEMAAQMKGQLFKDGGPVIGVQIENEFPFEKEPATSYMYELKKMARAHGMDVPLYTEFAWPGGPPGQTDFLPMRGRYPDAPWSNLLTRLTRDEVYRFEPVKFDPLIGEDLFGKRLGDTGARQPFPIAMAELGSGLQPSYRRRVLLNGDDVVASAYVQLGCGANMLGYYVFHGAINPVGKLSTFQEAKESGHISPGDLPMLNYDFQAPLGMYGFASPSFYQYRALHLFLNDFGSSLAPATPVFPGAPAKDIPPLRYCVRASGDSGFLFVNNYRRFLGSPDIPGVQFRIGTQAGAIEFPGTPCTVPSGSYFIWPFNLDMSGTRLRYATAQPLCIIPSGGELLYVFSAVDGIAPEYNFAASSVESAGVDVSAAVEIDNEGGAVLVKVKEPGTASAFSLTAASGQRIRVLTLTHKQSLAASKVTLGGKAHLLLTPGQVLSEDTVLRLRQQDLNTFAFSIYPNASLQAGVPLQAAQDGLLVRYSATLPPKPPMTLDAVQENASSNTETPVQNPPWYQPGFASLPGAALWSLPIPCKAMEGCQDVRIDVHYTGDFATLYAGGRLVMDQFNYNGVFPISLRHCGEKADSFKLQIMPFGAGSQVYSDDPAVRASGTQATIGKIEAHPVYQLVIKAASKR